MNGKDKSLNELKAFITTHMGWSLSRFNDQELRQRIEAVGKELGFGSFSEFAQHLLSTPMTERETQAIANRFTIGESFFFRYRSDFDVLSTDILPTVIKEKRNHQPIQIWCAGCSSGEEPYTTAIYLTQHFPNLNQRQIQIFGTDINALALQKARAGIYTPWSLRDTQPEEKRQYFDQKNDRWQLSSAIRSWAQFSYLNLAENQYFIQNAVDQKFDVIFCRNVLIYFSEEKIIQVLENFLSMLTPGGALIVSPCESSLVPTHLYSHDIIKSTTVLRPVNGSSVNSKRSFNRTLLRTKKAITKTLRLTSSGSKQNTSQASPEIEKSKPIDYFQKAKWLYQDGSYEAAAGVILMLIRGNTQPVKPEHFQLLIESLINDKKTEEALYWCNHALELNRISTEFRYLKASILQELNRYNDARQVYLDILFLEPNSIGANFFLASLEQQQGNGFISQKYFKKAYTNLETQNPENLADGMDGMTIAETAKILKGLING